jgi:hypothetical protein
MPALDEHRAGRVEAFASRPFLPAEVHEAGGVISRLDNPLPGTFRAPVKHPF